MNYSPTHKQHNNSGILGRFIALATERYHKSRIHRLGWLALLLLVAIAPPKTEAEMPNILFLLADDLGWRDLGCYNTTFYESPTLDQLAKDGIRFTHAYTAGTVCSPTRASIITGQTPARHGCTNWGGSIKPENHIGMARALRNGGYHTFFTGKWHIGTMTPELAGFSTVQEISPRDGSDEDPKSTRQITSNTLAFLKKQRLNHPFFAYVNYHAVHLPLKESPQVVSKYRRKLMTNPPQAVGPTGLEKEHQRSNKQLQDNPQYAAMVEAVDDSVSQILATLKTQGFENNTLVIFSSDNGGLSTKPCTSNLPLRAGKGWAYEGGIRVPLIVRWPEHITANTTTDTPVTSMDFYPTLLTIAGLPLLPKQHLDGVSIAKLLNSNEPLARDTLYWHYPHYHGAGCSPVGALREGDLKLIHWFGADRYELYDLNDDPSELKDLSTSRIQDLSRLTGKLKRWQALFPKIKYNETNPFR